MIAVVHRERSGRKARSKRGLDENPACDLACTISEVSAYMCIHETRNRRNESDGGLFSLPVGLSERKKDKEDSARFLESIDPSPFPPPRNRVIVKMSGVSASPPIRTELKYVQGAKADRFVPPPSWGSTKSIHHAVF